MFAVITIGNKQFKVSEGDTIVTDRLQGKEGETVTLDHVLLTSEGKSTRVGRPTVKDIVVKAKILSQGKGEKVEIRRFKAKVRYRRARGFRPHQTTLAILSIGRA